MSWCNWTTCGSVSWSRSSEDQVQPHPWSRSTKRVKFDSGLSREELESYIQSRIMRGEEHDALDINKYNKSQDELPLLVFAGVLLREGVAQPLKPCSRWPTTSDSLPVSPS